MQVIMDTPHIRPSLYRCLVRLLDYQPKVLEHMYCSVQQCGLSPEEVEVRDSGVYASKTKGGGNGGSRVDLERWLDVGWAPMYICACIHNSCTREFHTGRASGAHVGMHASPLAFLMVVRVLQLV
jgi:hypothetical protein